MESYDLAGCQTLKELRQGLDIQAKRTLRQLDISEPEYIQPLIRSWLKGKHYSVWKDHLEEMGSKIDVLAATDSSKALASSWLAVLYREWLVERGGLSG